MKKLYTSSLIIVGFFVFGQVGINTQTPRDQLDVNGGILVDSYLILDQTNTAIGEQQLIVRSTDSSPVGEIKLLDVDIRNVGPINKYRVRIDNVDDMRVIQLNTNLDANKYYFGLAEAVYSGVTSSGAGAQIKNLNTSGNPIQGTYYTSVGVDQGKYKITLNFNNAGTNGNRNGYWDISFIVFENVLVKDWGTFSGSVSQSNSYKGVSTNTPVGLQ